MNEVSRTLKKALFGVRAKFLLVFFSLSVIPIVLISILGFQMTQKIIINKTYEDLSLQNELTRQEIYRFMLETHSLLSPSYTQNLKVYRRMAERIHQAVASGVFPEDKIISQWMNRLLSVNNFKNVWVLDAKFNILKAAVNSRIPALPPVLKNISEVKQVTPQTISAQMCNGSLCLNRIEDKSGRVAGFVIGEVNYPNLVERINSPGRRYKGIHTTIRKPKDKNFVLTSDLDIQILMSKNAAAGNSGAASSVRLDRGKRIILTAKPLGILGWEVVSEVPFSVAMSDVYRFRNRAALGIGFLLVVLIILAFSFSRLLTGPVRALATAAKQIGEGRLESPIPIRSMDEIGVLAREFDEMRIKLKDSYENLEAKVRERTRELRSAQFQIVHQEKMASLGLMAAGIAHEIGNPLTSISSLIQLMRRNCSDDIFAENLETVLSNIKRISKIVRELVDFSAPSSDKIEPTYVNSVIESVVGIMRYDQRSKNVSFHLQLEENLPPIPLIADQLRQVLFNLLVNAVDAMENYGSDLYVRSGRGDNRLFIEIEDTGSGIPESDIQKIFEPFFTTKDVGKGTGLGLSVSYGIIQQFHGEITVKSKVGEGTVFTINLPIEPKEGKI